MNLSNHAKTQAQRRGIEQSVVNYVVKYGHRVYDGKGAIRCFFTNKSRKKLEQTLPQKDFAKINDKKLKCFAVVAEDSNLIITVGHQIKKINK
jgi:hypothetical protein